MKRKKERVHFHFINAKLIRLMGGETEETETPPHQFTTNISFRYAKVFWK